MEQSVLGWHGLIGDRRYGVRKIADKSDFPWLCASGMPELLRFKPAKFDLNSAELLPTHVQNPSGILRSINDPQLVTEIRDHVGIDVELMAFKHGIFDDAVISLIGTSTAGFVCSEAGIDHDTRRFRANIEIECDDSTPFIEDQWVGKVISIGEANDSPAFFVTKRDVRCKMISLDPDTAEHNPKVLKAAVRLNENNAGVYGTVVRTGRLCVGHSVFLSNSTESVVVQ